MTGTALKFDSENDAWVCADEESTYFRINRRQERRKQFFTIVRVTTGHAEFKDLAPEELDDAMVKLGISKQI